TGLARQPGAAFPAQGAVRRAGGALSRCKGPRARIATWPRPPIGGDRGKGARQGVLVVVLPRLLLRDQQQVAPGPRSRRPAEPRDQHAKQRWHAGRDRWRLESHHRSGPAGDHRASRQQALTRVPVTRTPDSIGAFWLALSGRLSPRRPGPPSGARLEQIVQLDELLGQLVARVQVDQRRAGLV